MKNAFFPLPSRTLSWRWGQKVRVASPNRAASSDFCSKERMFAVKGALYFRTSSRQCMGPKATYHPIFCKLHLTVTRWSIEVDVVLP